MGRDPQGRQITEFIPGRLAPDDRPLALKDLTEIGEQIRQIHDIASGFSTAAEETWTTLIPAPDADLICHNDLAPWNFIMGDRQAFIDWDGAGPSTRLWDLAYAAQSFGFLVAGQDPYEAAQRLRTLVVDGYKADAGLRSGLPVAMGERTQAMYDFLGAAHRDDFQPWGEMFLNGHGHHWDEASKFVRKHQSLWMAALRT
ncbi:phosphotransferase [Arthrobacter sp. GMC3]|uniref:phosphotransferase n=1 Tax=Arthrobacter sp. GMC3 TaxID=2058894 RepID=UPI0027951F84|nr:phosphotransferase [Arthrobacter sp. GMC3]